ncbi:MAG TPA: AraC family transcriptional regulator [Puia sp.]|nr:AraC family transcriptional regulator [Puia sp.]
MKEPVEFEKGCYVGSKIREQSFGCILTTETVFQDGFASDWHYHQNPHYSHILSGGSKEIRRGVSRWQQPGDGLYYYPGIPHQNVQYRPGTRIFNIEVDAGFFKEHGLDVPAEEHMFSDRLKVNSTGLIKILREHYWQDRHSTIAVEQLCINLISASPLAHNDYPDWTRKIIEILNDKWNHSWSLNEFSGMLDIHPVTLSKYFSKYFKCTLGDYIRRIKIDKALTLIRSNRHSLTEIAYLCGFSDQAHFIRTFTLLTGMIPKQYRKI